MVSKKCLLLIFYTGKNTVHTLAQTEADALFRLEKIRADDGRYQFPDTGGRLELPLASVSGRESFSLDISRRRIVLHVKYQLRARQTAVLLRLDFNAPHKNPDDEEIGVPHLHVYREGFGDKWAYPVPEGMLTNPEDAWSSLQDFMRYCNITKPPLIERGLFADQGLFVP